MQETIVKPLKPVIHIPATKRCYALNQPLTDGTSSSPFFSLQSPYETLKIQFQDIKPSLELRPQQSGFTRVFSHDQDIDNIKQQSTVCKISCEENEKYQNQLQKLIQLIVKEECIRQKQQKKLTFNTKNILRNVCNAQNQFILFHFSAQKTIESHLSNPQKFKAWVNRLRYHTFEQFQRIWNIKQKGVFSKLYRKLCRKFYTQNAIPYIMNSRIKNKQTKLAHVRYLYRFLQGLQNPSDFCYFKPKDRENA